MHESVQILVVGGGPAGSTAATLLAREGFAVTLLEREHFPRYHIGESLLPSCLPILDLMGAREKIENHGFQRKGGAYFEWGTEKWDLRFDELDDTTYSWQVVRSEFDHLLLEHAKSQGVDVREGVTVKEVLFDDDGRAVQVRWENTDRTDHGEISFDFMVDASGRAGLLATKHLRSRRFHDVFKNVGFWGYWKGTKPIEQGPDGAIAVCSIPEGWLWAIPLHDDTVSIGVVTGKEHFRAEQERQGQLADIYMEKIKSSTLTADLIEGAELVSEIKAETDYSYVTENFAGPGYLLAGDAACFLDPLLSTGVHLATYSGLLAAASVSSILRDGTEEDRALRFYASAYEMSYERLLVLVSVFYQTYRGRDEHFFEAQKLTAREKNQLNLHEAFLNIVTGIEDLADAKERAFDAVAARLAGPDALSNNPLVNHNASMEQMPDSPSRALDGLYLETEPKLTLRAVADVPAEA
ncbi:FAD-binding protein [Actinosynnema sp. ALI-1.44]|uniref:NAD(P)/FAD-dependent oxidoreductase n=1 Tax=Actinosynnema sp. ALI-1.44 TaxID=1933779 RepID=UPI00097C42BC|nr:NAD(P)/FAD-dependent oxidoreductase [Actinosynnema sp. ALI-1.44]ONI88619.1 FAD-binding protein [Actinosynnema sp. ALI-1.44]